jgi:hypothetical protein
LFFPAPQWAGKKTAGQPVGFGAALCGWLIVDVFSMPYFPDIHNHYFIINGIYYPVSAYSDTPVFRTAFEFFDPCGLGSSDNSRITFIIRLLTVAGNFNNSFAADLLTTTLY